MRSLFASVAVSLVACAGVAEADLSWGFISTSGDPDPVTAFDLASPGTSNTALGFTATNFNRGMDFDSENSFYYYVSTDSLNDPGDRGLWYWDNGANTQLGTIPFSDSGDGDATLGPGNGRFFVSTDDNDSADGDSIYAFDNLNGSPTFTEIGETGLSQIIGLAAHPISGLLYGYDSSTEGLYTIDSSTGAATLVGSSGMSFPAIGGMDFDASGSTLLLSVGGDLYTVDITSGAVTAAGDVGLNVSALSYRVPAPGAASLLALGGLAAARRRRA